MTVVMRTDARPMIWSKVVTSVEPRKTRHPIIIQGGMGVGISDWRLAQAVCRCGQLGVVSGTAIDAILVRRLQAGDPGDHMRRGLAQFPFQRMAARILERYYIPGG